MRSYIFAALHVVVSSRKLQVHIQFHFDPCLHYWASVFVKVDIETLYLNITFFQYSTIYPECLNFDEILPLKDCLKFVYGPYLEENLGIEFQKMVCKLCSFTCIAQYS